MEEILNTLTFKGGYTLIVPVVALVVIVVVIELILRKGGK